MLNCNYYNEIDKSNVSDGEENQLEELLKEYK